MSDTGRDPGPAAGDSGPSQDERGELRGQRPGPVRRRRFGWRTLVAAILIVLGCLLAPVSVLAVWAANEVGNTGRYMATMEPLARNPAIQNALTDKITNQITTRLNVTSYADQAAAALSSRGLPKASTLLKSVTPSIASGAAGFIHSEVHKIVTGPRFARAWVRANTVVHQELVKALSGQGSSSVSVKNGQVVVGLGPFIDVVKQDLVNRGFTLVSKIPAVNPTLTLFSARYLVKAQTGYRLINDLKIVLPILTMLLLALGVRRPRPPPGPDRRRARPRRVDAGARLGAVYLPRPLPGQRAEQQAARRRRCRLVRHARPVHQGSAPHSPGSGPGRRRRRVPGRADGDRGPDPGGFAHGLGQVRRGGEHAGLRTGPVGTWTYAHRRALRISAVALAALVFVFRGLPTAVVVIAIAVLLVVVLGLIELIGSKPPAQPEEAGQP